MKYILKGLPTIIVGTPGRMLTICTNKVVRDKLENVKQFIFDECDQLIGDESLRNKAQKIFMMTPKEKQTLMFTATLSEENKENCTRFLRNPDQLIIDDKNLTLYGLKQYYCKLEEKEKTRKLVNLLKTIKYNQIIIFVKNNSRSKGLRDILKDEDIKCKAVCSDLSMKQRQFTLKMFKKDKAKVLVATDLF